MDYKKEIETTYAPTMDITFVMETTHYSNDSIREKVLGFYHGTENPQYTAEVVNELNLKRIEALLYESVNWVDEHCPTEYDFVIALRSIGYTKAEINKYMDINLEALSEEERMELQLCV